jgi:hypothetical protein
MISLQKFLLEDRVTVLSGDTLTEMANLKVKDLNKPFYDKRNEQYNNRAGKLLDMVRNSEAVKTMWSGNYTALKRDIGGHWQVLPKKVSFSKSNLTMYISPNSHILRALENLVDGKETFTENLIFSTKPFTKPVEITDGVSQFLNPSVNEHGVEKEILAGNLLLVGKLGNIKKTGDFGSSTGSGLGAKGTDIEEGLIAQVADGLDVTYTQKFRGLSDAWKRTVVKTGEALRARFVAQDSSVIFCHKSYNSKYYNAILNKFKSITTEVHKDKWNPADIWAVFPENFYMLDEVQDLSTLNGILGSNLLLDKQGPTAAVGISLKKLGTNGDIHIVSEIPQTGTRKSKPVFFKNSILRATYGVKGKSCTLNFRPVPGIVETGIMFRTYENKTSFAGQLLGKNAAGGKVGLTVINSIISECGGTLVLSAKAMEMHLAKKYGILPRQVTDYQISRAIVNGILLNLFSGPTVKVLTKTGSYDEPELSNLGIRVLEKLVIHAASLIPGVSGAYLKVY